VSSNAVENVVERGRDIVDVLGIDGGDEGLVQACEDLVDHFVAAVLKQVISVARPMREFPCAPRRAAAASPRR